MDRALLEEALSILDAFSSSSGDIDYTKPCRECGYRYGMADTSQHHPTCGLGLFRAKLLAAIAVHDRMKWIADRASAFRCSGTVAFDPPAVAGSPLEEPHGKTES